MLRRTLLAIKGRNDAFIANFSRKIGPSVADLERYAGLPENALAPSVVRDFDFFPQQQVEVGRKRP